MERIDRSVVREGEVEGALVAFAQLLVLAVIYSCDDSMLLRQSGEEGCRPALEKSPSVTSSTNRQMVEKRASF